MGLVIWCQRCRKPAGVRIEISLMEPRSSRCGSPVMMNGALAAMAQATTCRSSGSSMAMSGRVDTVTMREFASTNSIISDCMLFENFSLGYATTRCNSANRAVELWLTMEPCRTWSSISQGLPCQPKAKINTLVSITTYWPRAHCTASSTADSGVLLRLTLADAARVIPSRVGGVYRLVRTNREIIRLRSSG